MVFTIKIPVTEKQNQLLKVMVGPSPFKASYKNALGKLILNNFRGQKGIKRQNTQKYQGLYFEIIIPYTWIERHGVQFISDQSVQDFMEYLKKEFEMRMFCYIDSVLDFKQRYNTRKKQTVRGKAAKDELLVAKMKEAALCFLDKNGLNEDFMAFDTIKKSYQRYEGKPSTIGIYN